MVWDAIAPIMTKFPITEKWTYGTLETPSPELLSSTIIAKNMCAQFVECHRHIVLLHIHNSDVTMSVMASQIASVSIVCPTVCTGANQRKHQSFVSLVFVRGIHRWPVDSPYKRPVTRKMFPFDDVIMWTAYPAGNHSFRWWLITCLSLNQYRWTMECNWYQNI